MFEVAVREAKDGSRQVRYVESFDAPDWQTALIAAAELAKIDDREQFAYEGYVRYADNSIVSIQCFEGRCDECPQNTDPDCDGPTCSGPLEGYYCEHCDHSG